MLGTVVNALAIILGGLIGLLVRGAIADRYKTGVMHAIGLAVIMIGLRAARSSDAIVITIISMAAGTLVGEWLAIEKRLEQLGGWAEQRLASAGDGFARGFVTASLLYCVGSMAVVGALESGLKGDHQTLMAKSMLDGITSVVLSSTFGLGVMFAALPVFLYQGGITLSAVWVKPYLSTDLVSQVTGVGGLLILAIGINILELRRLRVGNMLPAIFMPLVMFWARQWVGKLL